MALLRKKPKSRAEQLAERDAAQNEGFLREVDEALREDEFLAMAKRHGLTVGLVVVAGLGALGGYLWWGSHQDNVRAQRSEQITIATDALDAGKFDEAAKLLDPIAAKGAEGSKTVAQLMQAGIALAQGKEDPAASIYASIAADSTAPQAYRDLATVREVALRFDSMKPEDVIARLKPLALPGDPWFGSAGELVGMAYLKQGRKDLAGPLFATIARDRNTPDSLRARVRQLAGQLGFDAIDDIALVADTPAPAAAAK